MKLRILNDLHLEFGNLDVPELPEDNETVLILAGDIHTGTNATDFIATLLTRFAHVVYILGNHEFYHNDMTSVRLFWQQTMKYHHNLHVLDPGTLELEGLRIIGATLWTGTNDPQLNMFMNDFACIHLNGKVLTTEATRELFLIDLDYIRAELEKPFEGKTIVVTHHAPIEECVRPRWIGHFLNPCFHSRLNFLFHDYDIDMWIHGHMHDTVDIQYEGTHIYANPRGYAGYEENPNFETEKVLGV